MKRDWMNGPGSIGLSPAWGPVFSKVLVALVLFAALARSAEAAPLTWPETDLEDLYQRVLTRPRAKLYPQPDQSSGGTEQTLFSVFYVFARERQNSEDWVQVGPRRDGTPTGWILARETEDWRQNIVLLFEPPRGRKPILFFKSDGDLRATFEDPPWTGDQIDRIIRSARQDGEASSGVIAVEPETWPDYRTQFYLIPILKAEKVSPGGGRRRRRGSVKKIVQVASIPEPGQADQTSQSAILPNFRGGIVFVVDTTSSMGPYIDRARQIVRALFDRLSSEPEVRDRLSFGLVGFRDNLDARPGLDYVTRVFHPIEKDFNRSVFLSAIDNMAPATVSSQGFEEDGLAGVDTAMRMPGWKHFGGRWIIFISDAPVRVSGDELASSPLTPQTLANDARRAEKPFAIFSFLLETPEGRRFHSKAEDQYRDLSNTIGGTEQFYGIARGDVDQYGSNLQAIACQVSAIVRAAAQGQDAAQLTAEGCADDADEGGSAVAESVLDTGLAMQLAWVGGQVGTQAPDMFKGWAADFRLEALRDPARTFSVRVLMTRAQLNDLYRSLRAILRTARNVEADESADFFDTLRTVLAQAQQDPSLLGSLDPSDGAGRTVDLGDGATRLADLVDGYIAQLPYESDLLNYDRETLAQLGPSQIRDIINEVQAKIRRYEQYFGDQSLWVSLNENDVRSEQVYPVPLEQLP